MRQPGEKPELSATAKARIEMFHEQLAKLESLWGVEVITSGAMDTIAYVDVERTDDWDGFGTWDAHRDANGKLQFETFEGWGK